MIAQAPLTAGLPRPVAQRFRCARAAQVPSTRWAGGCRSACASSAWVSRSGSSTPSGVTRPQRSARCQKSRRRRSSARLAWMIASWDASQRERWRVRQRSARWSRASAGSIPSEIEPVIVALPLRRHDGLRDLLPVPLPSAPRGGGERAPGCRTRHRRAASHRPRLRAHGDRGRPALIMAELGLPGLRTGNCDRRSGRIAGRAHIQPAVLAIAGRSPSRSRHKGHPKPADRCGRSMVAPATELAPVLCACVRSVDLASSATT